ncbi:MAG: hypothetical protein J7494_08980 [Sphingobium sp.]|nr:hypothetical protein [Sphingobium sp.]
MTKRKESRDDSESPDFAFDPVIVRTRHDGWTVEKQVAFIQALAECGCVTEACARVGMSDKSAYGLRTRLDAQSFRYAWEAALDHAVQRLSDAAFSRALNGVARPVFFQGEQVGERRYYDENLTRFLLRYRDPVRYGKFKDTQYFERDHADAAALTLSQLLLRVLKDGHAFDGDDPRPVHESYRPRPSMIENFDYFCAQLDARLEAARARAKGKGGKGNDPGWSPL